MLILKGLALRQRDAHQLEAANMFLQLHDSEWAEKISSHALRCMANRKFNKGKILPVTGDLVKLRKFLLEEMNDRSKALQQKPIPEDLECLDGSNSTQVNSLQQKKRG